MKTRSSPGSLTATGFLLVLTTAASKAEAQRLSRDLLQRKLAGCVNLVPRLDSFYWWKGKIEHGSEVLLLIKTSRRRIVQLAHFLKSTHSYEVPELIALPILWGDQVYLNWLRQSLEIR